MVKEFLNQIAEFFPKSDAISFATQLPGNDSDEFNLHLTDLSWLPHSSTKPAPYLHTCLQLWDEITTNGFITKGASISSCLLCIFSLSCRILQVGVKILSSRWGSKFVC